MIDVLKQSLMSFGQLVFRVVNISSVPHSSRDDTHVGVDTDKSTSSVTMPSYNNDR